MDIQINKEFRDYSEKIYFGLNMRQLIFSALAVVMAVGSYFLLKPYLSLETLSWLCIILAALGFVTYNGMTAEQFVWAFIKSEFLTPKRLIFKAESDLCKQSKELIKQKEKEIFKANENA
ncbi:MAG: PrgI family protein [Acetobacter sp.]|nr:PrgI family protein [Bacteroides sp.]MCM1342168.1 PrgI family protein [Acetobacter sp.]MCM1433153.1 PrgI family protein [Clostridiales bacterium]